MKRQRAALIKNREQQQLQEAEEAYFLGLPIEVWQRLIWPACGLSKGLAWASACRQWHRLACGAIRHLTQAMLQSGPNELFLFTESGLRPFKNLRALDLEAKATVIASSLPALTLLSTLRTLAIVDKSPGHPKVHRLHLLTQLTALDVSPRFSGSKDFGFFALTQLRLLRAHCLPEDTSLQLSRLPSLTFLDIEHCNFSLEPWHFARMTNLQFLSVRFCWCGSFAFLTQLHALVFLDVVYTHYTAESAIGPALRSLTSLTSLAIGSLPIPLDTILAMTRLRTLEFSDSFYPPSDNDFGLHSLSPPVMQKLTHLQSLSYNCHRLCGNEKKRVTELGLETGNDGKLRALRDFTGWHHPLPPDYFNTSCPSSSLFVNDT